MKDKRTILIPSETDLRSITRNADRCLTEVTIKIGWDLKIKWLVFGQSQIFRQTESGKDGRWRLEAFLPVGVTDCEHDSAFALKLPLIGLQLGSPAVYYHTASYLAWVDPSAGADDSPDFHVPRSGYNPLDTTLARAYECTECTKKKHLIVSRYVPEFDAELFKAVSGKMVEIAIGPVSSKED